MGASHVMSIMAGLATVLGGVVPLVLARSVKQVHVVTAIATGYLLGAAMLTILPGVIRSPGAARFLALGFFGFMLIKFLTEVGAKRACEDRRSGPLQPGIILSMAAHAFAEGSVLGLLARSGATWGVIAAAGFALHKIPEGFSLSAVVFETSGSWRRAIVSVLFVGVALVGGALLSGHWTMRTGTPVAIAAGATLYVGAVELLPATIRRGGIHHLYVVAGVALAEAVAAL